MFIGSLRLKGGVHVIAPWQHPSQPDPHHVIIHWIVVHRAARRLYKSALGNILQLTADIFKQEYARSVLRQNMLLGVMRWQQSCIKGIKEMTCTN